MGTCGGESIPKKEKEKKNENAPVMPLPLGYFYSSPNSVNVLCIERENQGPKTY